MLWNKEIMFCGWDFIWANPDHSKSDSSPSKCSSVLGFLARLWVNGQIKLFEKSVHKDSLAMFSDSYPIAEIDKYIQEIEGLVSTIVSVTTYSKKLAHV